MKKIVVVDDQPVLASIYRAKFLAEGFHVDVAADGEQALEVINRTKPDLVLLDLMLPKIKGIDVLRRLRANPIFKTLPIVVFSNSGQSGAVEEAWAAGASMVLSKSRTSPKQMVESVLNALATSTPPENTYPPATGSALPKIANRPAKLLEERILLVESHPETRAMLAMMLTLAGYQLSLADGPGHALLLSETVYFDLVVINQSLCRESAASFCQEVRRQHSQLPVVMYSMGATPMETKQALANGVSRYLTTPEELFNVAEISTVLIAHRRIAA